MYVSSCWPHDRAYGGQLRALQIGRALQHFGRPTLVMVGADPVDAEARARTVAEFDLARELPVGHAPVRGVGPRSRLLFDPLFTNIHGLTVSAADEAWLLGVREQFDLIWFFKLRTANFFRTARWPRSVVDVDDLPSAMEGARGYDGADAHVPLKTRVRKLVLRRQERHLGRRFEVLCVCSEADRAALDARAPIHVIPNGFERPCRGPARTRSEPPRIGFMGLFRYQPNREGVRWFVERCWPRIQREIPGVRLRLVGTDTDGPLKPDDPAVDGLGWVGDPTAEVGSWSLMIVPLRIGGGTRVKIPDAFSRKCPLVSTRFGAFGYDVEHGRELLLADDPEEFASACLSLIRDRETAVAMADRAYQRFLENWTWEAIAPRVWAAVEDGLRNRELGPRR